MWNLFCHDVEGLTNPVYQCSSSGTFRWYLMLFTRCSCSISFRINECSLFVFFSPTSSDSSICLSFCIGPCSVILHIVVDELVEGCVIRRLNGLLYESGPQGPCYDSTTTTGSAKDTNSNLPSILACWWSIFLSYFCVPHLKELTQNNYINWLSKSYAKKNFTKVLLSTINLCKKLHVTHPLKRLTTLHLRKRALLFACPLFLCSNG